MILCTFDIIQTLIEKTYKQRLKIYYSCWLSIFESVIWWLAAPICFTVAISLIVLFLSMKAAFTLKEHVLGFGNLR